MLLQVPDTRSSMSCDCPNVALETKLLLREVGTKPEIVLEGTKSILGWGAVISTPCLFSCVLPRAPFVVQLPPRPHFSEKGPEAQQACPCTF